MRVSSSSSLRPSLLLLSLIFCLLSPVASAQIKVVSGSDGCAGSVSIGGAKLSGIRTIATAMRASYLWRNFATTGARANEYEVYVPFGCAGRYAVFSFQDYLANGVLNFGRIKEGIVARQQLHSAATKVGTWANATAAGGLPATQSTTAGDTITFSVTGHTLFLRASSASNGGFATVAIDGSYTAATRLPAVTQADIDAGYFSAGDIGKRYINFYGVGTYGDEHYPLVEGLTNGPHTVTVRVQGTKVAAASAARAYVVAAAGASGWSRPADSGTAMYYTREISNQRNATSFSATGVVANFAPDNVTFEWVGETHGNESQSAATWAIDGQTVTMATDEYRSGATISLARTTSLLHSTTGATAMASKVATYTFTASRDYPARMVYAITCQHARTISAEYTGMLPVGLHVRTSATSSQTEFTSVRIGGTFTSSSITANDGSELGHVQALWGEFSSANHTTRAAVRIDATNINGWVKSAPDYAFMADRSDLDKIYFSRSTSANNETVAVNDVHSGVIEWRVFRP